MNKYLKEHINEEIEGAFDYMTKAIELKKTHPEISARFFKMAEMELEHANCLTKIFSSMPKDSNITDAEYAEIQHSIIEAYSTSMSKYEQMKKLYYAN